MFPPMRRVLLFLVFLGVLLSGCATRPDGDPSDRSADFLGLVNVEEASFLPPDATTFALSENEVIDNEVRSGRKVSLLWGLVTYTDY